MTRLLRTRALYALIVLPVVAASCLIGASSAVATTAVTSSATVTASASKAPPVQASHASVHMFAYDDSHFTSAAAKLPSGLIAALHRDLNISAATYLADADASARAVQVVDSLSAHGVDVLGSSISGTTLTVNVASARDAAAVTAVGAKAVVGAPKAVDLGDRKAIAASSPLYDGEAYYWEDAQYYRQCSVGFTGFAKPSGAHQFVTAGHCFSGELNDGTPTSAAQLYALHDAKPALVDGARWDSAIADGQVATPGAFRFGGGDDSGLMNVGSGVASTTDIATWGGKTAKASGSGGALPYQSSPLTLTGETEAIKGAHLCKSGSRTGWSCGKILAVNETVNVYDNGYKTVNSIIATTCILPGDSGGAAVIGTLAVGIDSSSVSATSCSSSKYWAGYFPMVTSSSHASVSTQSGSVWEPQVSLRTPVITYPSATQTIASNTRSLTGTLSGAGTGDTVIITVSGQAPVSVSASSGTWTYPLAGISGSHSVTVQAAFGSFSRSATATHTFAVYPPASFAKPTITGTARVDSTLTAHTKITPSTNTVAYQWKAGTTAVGSNLASYVPTAADVGKKITVTVTGATADYAWSAASTSSSTKAVVRATITKHSLVVSGHRNVGSQLSVGSATAWGPAPVTLSYQWYRSGKAITDGTGAAATYSVVSADRGKTLDVKVTGTKPGYSTTSSTVTTKTLTGYPLQTLMPTPTIDGTPTVGQVLTAEPGTWDTGAVQSYQWRLGGKSISKATHQTFTIPLSYVGKVLTVTVTSKESARATQSDTSAATTPIASLPFTTAPVPTVSGTHATGRTLTAVPGTWSPKATFGYRWLRDGSPISKATKSTYKQVSADVGHTITVRITGKRTGYTTTVRDSVAV